MLASVPTAQRCAFCCQQCLSYGKPALRVGIPTYAPEAPPMHHTSAGSLLPCPKPVARNNRVIPRARRIGNQLIPGSCCPQAAVFTPTFSSVGDVGVEKLKFTNADELRVHVVGHAGGHLSGALLFELGDSNPHGLLLGLVEIHLYSCWSHPSLSS